MMIINDEMHVDIIMIEFEDEIEIFAFAFFSRRFRS